MSKTRTPSPNDQRSMVKNPGTPAYELDRQNRIKLGHDDVPPPAPTQAPNATPQQPEKREK